MVAVSRPIRVLSFGAGVQSSYVARASLLGDLPPFDHVVFADTGDEPDDVMENVAWWADRFKVEGVPVHVVRKPKSISETVYETLDGGRSGVPIPVFIRNRRGHAGQMGRQCTSSWKVEQIKRVLRQVADVPHRHKHITDALVEQTIGISWDEAVRMRDAPYPWVRNAYPLVDDRITRWECIRIMAGDDRFPDPPRSACWHCPYRSVAEWRHLRDHQPESWTKAVELDRALRRDGSPLRGDCYLHPSLTPLDEVDLSTEEDRGQGVLWDAECEGMCGL